MLSFYVLDNRFNISEWRLRRSEVESYMTFKRNFTGLVACGPWSSWHLPARMELRRWRCESSLYMVFLHRLMMRLSDEWNSCLDNGMDFDDFFPTFRKTELWAQWRKYSRYCFGTGESHALSHTH